MFQESLRVYFGELLRIGNGLQDLGQVLCSLHSIHGRRFKSAGRGMLKTKSLKNRHDMVAQP